MKQTLTVRSLNKLLKDNGRAHDTEVTRYKGEFWLLHILKNNVPVPLYHTKDLTVIKEQIERLLED